MLPGPAQPSRFLIAPSHHVTRDRSPAEYRQRRGCRTGEVRIGAATYPIREGDFIGCPPGDRATAHQIVNTGREELRFLAVSTKESLDIAEYPDTGKFGVLSEDPDFPFRFVGRASSAADYWEGE
jgi:uncharacterized cupin superfamily protein